jgi:HlyD family secretion protein
MLLAMTPRRITQNNGFRRTTFIMSKRILSVSFVLMVSLLLVACGGSSTAAATPAPTPASVNSTLNAEGNLEPRQSAELSFGISGEVAEVLVKEGDSIKAGDLIARLKSDTQRNAVAQAEAAVAVAQANLAQYQSNLPQQIAAAEADIKAAQAQISSAAAKRDNRSDVIQAEAALAQAKYAQQQAETAYNRVLEYKKFGTTEETARLALETAVKNTQSAQARLDALQAGSPNDRATGAQIGAASANQKAAQARLDQLKAEAEGKTDSTFVAAVKQAEATRLSAKTALADAELRAPFTGTIATIDLKPGERVAPGVVKVVLADLSGWRITTDDLTETKVPSIKVGQAVTIRIDALPELTLKGEVESIGAVSQLKSGDVTYPVKIKVLDVDPRLRWGMTVAVTFAED